jgi:hypothetical protein
MENLVQFDQINGMITLSMITLSGKQEFVRNRTVGQSFISPYF